MEEGVVLVDGEAGKFRIEMGGRVDEEEDLHGFGKSWLEL